MSFCNDCKSEMIAAAAELKPCCLSAHLYGYLLFFSRIGSEEFALSAENREILDHFIGTLEEYGIRLSGEEVVTKAKRSTLRITDPRVCETLFEDFGLSNSAPLYTIDRSLFLCEDCVKAFLAGAFLASGSVTDPEKSYHLEFSTHRSRIASGLAGILQDLDFTPGETARGYEKIVYFKSSEQIEDLLTTMGAPLASMAVMEKKIEKEIRNNVTRAVNCDNRNADRIATAAASDILLFTRFLEQGGEELLTEDLLALAKLRIEQPVTSMADLAVMCGGLTKSGVNHRLRKIREIAADYLNNKQ